MKFLPTNTLGYYKAAPQTHLHKLSDLPTAVFSASTKKYRDQCGQSKPDEDAVSFYTLNHAASIVRKLFTDNEPLPEWAQSIMSTYTDVCMAQGERIFHYLLCITTRETRHMKSGTLSFWKDVENKWGTASVDLLKGISSNSDEMAAVKRYQDTPPSITIGQYVETISYGFHHGSYNSGYGGKPWGDTTDALVSMLAGNTSLEMLLDTGYTLAHNGGPIFDKGMMYSHHGQNLTTVLDVQRSGQMLDLMFATNTLGITKTPVAEKAAELIKKHCAVDADGNAVIRGFVDWKLVDELRPQSEKDKFPNKYVKVKAAQTQQAQPTVKVKKKTTPKVKSKLVLGGKVARVQEVGPWQVYPGQVVQQFERVVK